MRNSKFKILFALLAFAYFGLKGQTKAAATQDNYVTYTPLDQSISTPSGVEVTANVRISCFGKQPDTGNWVITALLPPQGYLNHFPGTEFLQVGQFDDVEFRFKLDTSQTVTFLYEFKAEWYPDIGSSNHDTEYITIEVTYTGTGGGGGGGGGGGNDCTLSAPSGVSATTIEEYAVVIEWNNVSGNNGYSLRHRKKNTSVWTHESTTSPNTTAKIIVGLEQNTDYEVQVKTKCSNNDFGEYSPIFNFTTLPECPLDISITNFVPPNHTDIQEAQNTITASNKLYGYATAEYDAGIRVILKPGFSADRLSNFRAYIDGCTQTLTNANKSIVEETNRVDKVVKSLKLFPNPTTGRFNLESNENIMHWEIMTQFGISNKNGAPNVNDAKKAEIDISNFPIGIYFLKVTFKDGSMLRKTIIKE